MSVVDIAVIVRMLGDRIDDLVPALLPGARRDGHEWRCGGIDGSAGTSMAVRRHGGPGPGVWKDFASDNLKGDALDLVAHCRFGGDKAAALAWARSWLGMDGMDPARIRAVAVKAQKKRNEDEARQRERAEKKRGVAHALWLNAQAGLAGTPVDDYLRGRNIILGDLARAPGALRFAPAMDYPPSFNGGREVKFPAMVGLIQSHAGKPLAIHRTYLQCPQPGVAIKARVEKPKLVMGSYAGGFIALSRGASDRPIARAPEGDKVIICEGIEDGLSIMLAKPEYRVLAAISVGNFSKLQLPPAISTVIFAADNDDPDSPAGRALQAGIDAMYDQGRDVRITHSPVGKDFNDALRADAAMTGENA